MSLDVSPLFTSFNIKDRVMRNRIVMPPMVVLRGLTSPEGVAWYGEHAAGGPGLVIVEATGVPQFGDALTVENLRPLASELSVDFFADVV